MAKQIINLGQVANDRTGDPLRTAFDKVNANFTELYELTVDDVQIPTQAGNDGKFLRTDGTDLSWVEILTTAPTSIEYGLSNVSIAGTGGYVNIVVADTSTYTFRNDGRIVIPSLGELQINSSRTGSFNKDVAGGISDVRYTAEAWVTGIKLVIKVEGILDGDGTFTRHSQTCEATVAAIYNSTVTPVMSVYGVIYTSAAALATFTVRRGLDNVIEVVATNSQITESLHVSVHVTKFVSYYD